MADGHLNKCKKCTRKDSKSSNGIHKRECRYCKKTFKTNASQIKKTGAPFCSNDCYNLLNVGEEHPNWNGGKRKNGGKYMFLWVAPNTYRREHIVLMEKKIGRALKKDEVVHHRNGDKLDNRLKNLQLMTKSSHSSSHRRQEKKSGKHLFGGYHNN